MCKIQPIGVRFRLSSNIKTLCCENTGLNFAKMRETEVSFAGNNARTILRKATFTNWYFASLSIRADLR